MKIMTIMAVTILSFPVMAGEGEMQPLFDAWFAKHKNEVENQLGAACTGPECYKGRNPRNPERTDPVYKSWKQLRRQLIAYQEFDRHWGHMLDEECPTQWKAFKENHGDYDDFVGWARDNVLKYKGNWSSIDGSLGYGPPPETFLADRVDSGGFAVNAKGELTPMGGGSKTMFKYFMLPLILALIVAIWFSSRGWNASFGAVGTILAYGCATDLTAVLAFFFSFYLFFAVGVIFAFAGGVRFIMAIAKR